MRKEAAMRFLPLSPDDSDAILRMSRLATEIVKEHFDPLIGPAQNDYMIAHYQTPQAIADQLANGYHYFFVCDDANTPIGFLAYVLEPKRLYLSKFYLHKNHRGKGYSRAMRDFVIHAARTARLGRIELNVFKHNDATLAAYDALGFKRLRAEKNDIGNGFILDDYVYGLTLEK